MSEGPEPMESTELRLQQAVRDLYSMLDESGPDYVVFIDRRRMRTRVRKSDEETFRIAWETDEGAWLEQERDYANPREAAFRAYQGPH